MKFEYCVAIRTLGQAGEKYQQELDSLVNQTIPPKKIIVYIAEGYPIPKETIGVEQYVYCHKGMVAQRALPFSEIDTEWCLFLDDDVFLPPNAVETLYKSANCLKGDCIAADTFHNQSMSFGEKLHAFLTNWAFPRKDDKWAFKIHQTGNFSYNNNPSKDVYLSQSAAGPCSLWRMDAFRRIHFENELWMDKLGFAYGDDLLFFYKLYLNGGRLLVHYTSGIVHLDAQSAREKYKKDPHRLLGRSMAWFILWWRTHYNLRDNTVLHKSFSLAAFSLWILWQTALHLCYSLVTLSFSPLVYYFKGNVQGYKYVHSKAYRNLPNFILKHD